MLGCDVVAHLLAAHAGRHIDREGRALGIVDGRRIAGPMLDLDLHAEHLRGAVADLRMRRWTSVRFSGVVVRVVPPICTSPGITL